MEFVRHHRSLAAISDKATKSLDLKRANIYYTEEDIQFIRNNYLHKGANYCAKALGVSRDCIISIANKRLGIRDSTRNCKRSVYCVELNLTFESLKAAERYMCELLNKKRYHLKEAMKTENKVVAGYHWEYVED